MNSYSPIYHYGCARDVVTSETIGLPYEDLEVSREHSPDQYCATPGAMHAWLRVPSIFLLHAFYVIVGPRDNYYGCDMLCKQISGANASELCDLQSSPKKSDTALTTLDGPRSFLLGDMTWALYSAFTLSVHDQQPQSR